MDFLRGVNGCAYLFTWLCSWISQVKVGNFCTKSNLGIYILIHNIYIYIYIIIYYIYVYTTTVSWATPPFSYINMRVKWFVQRLLPMSDLHCGQ